MFCHLAWLISGKYNERLENEMLRIVVLISAMALFTAPAFAKPACEDAVKNMRVDAQSNDMEVDEITGPLLKTVVKNFNDTPPKTDGTADRGFFVYGKKGTYLALFAEKACDVVIVADIKEKSEMNRLMTKNPLPYGHKNPT